MPDATTAHPPASKPRDRTHTISIPEFWPLWINGRETPGRGGERISVENPANSELLCHTASATVDDVDDAVRAAAGALERWASMASAERVRILFRVAQHIRAAVEEIAILECLDCGKPLREARQDVEKTAEAFEFYAGAADKLLGTTVPISPEFFCYTVREPIGVTAHIAPWNFPLRLAFRSVAPALAAGNTVVLKPAALTPLSALRMARVLHEAGIPPGVMNVISGRGTVAGAALAGHAGIHHVAFTGSVEVGIDVAQRAARNVVPCTLELGGKSPNIVFSDADMDAAVEGAIKAMFVNAGQVCCAGTRLMLEDSIYDAFVERLIARTKRIRVGPGMEDPDMGPLISREQRKSVLEYIELGKREGGRILCGGDVPNDPSCRNGHFVNPTLLDGVANSCRIAQEEIFGPVLTVLRFQTDEDAARLANDSVYGLVAGIWTSNIDRAVRLASRIQAGQVYINDFFSGTVAMPFGGYKRSGYGRERGLEALHHYTQTKAVCAKLKKA